MFSLIGLQLPALIRDLPGGEAWPAWALAVAGTLIVTRILWVFPLSAVVQRRSGVRRGGSRRGVMGRYPRGRPGWPRRCPSR